jgi:hypothetical protein
MYTEVGSLLPFCKQASSYDMVHWPFSSFAAPTLPAMFL